jgi:hypothetical protein
MVSFDVVYQPLVPAEWGGIREAVVNGSLVFDLQAQVHQAGRYVVNARVVDARGQPLALLSFNDEVGTGSQRFRLTLFGRLIRDAQPAFPLRLQDVEGFLLLPDQFPDRAMLPRRAGGVQLAALRAGPLLGRRMAERGAQPLPDRVPERRGPGQPGPGRAGRQRP